MGACAEPRVDKGAPGTLSEPRVDRAFPGTLSEPRVDRAFPGTSSEMPCLQGFQSTPSEMPVDKGLPGIPAYPTARIARVVPSAYGSGSGFAIKWPTRIPQNPRPSYVSDKPEASQ